MRHRLMGCVLLALVMVPVLAAQPAVGKKRIAVFDFEDKTDHRVRWWRGGQGVGQGMADMCVTALVKSGNYTVIERDKLSQLMQEQGLGASGAVTGQTAAQLGKLLGVELAVFGAVTEFGYLEHKTGGRAPIPTPLKTKSVRVGVTRTAARVAVDVRLVNTSTGEIIAAETVVGEESKTGVSVSDARTSFQNQASFDESLVGKATRKAVDGVIEKIDSHAGEVQWQGSVVKTDATEVIINAGSIAGITIGDVLTIYSKGEALVDPETGLDLGSEETKIGTIRVVADMAQGKASRCAVISGSGGKRGDIVRY